VLRAYITTFKTPICMPLSNYFWIHMSFTVELEYKALWVPKKLNLNWGNAWNLGMKQMNELDEFILREHGIQHCTKQEWSISMINVYKNESLSQVIGHCCSTQDSNCFLGNSDQSGHVLVKWHNVPLWSHWTRTHKWIQVQSKWLTNEALFGRMRRCQIGGWGLSWWELTTWITLSCCDVKFSARWKVTHCII